MSTEYPHPQYYGGKSNAYEAIKVIEAWKVGFCLGNVLKYVCRAGRKDDRLKDLRKARWYLDREIQTLEMLEEGELMAIGPSTKNGKLLSTTIYITREQDAALDELKEAAGIPRSVVARDGIDLGIAEAQKKFRKELREHRNKMEQTMKGTKE